MSPPADENAPGRHVPPAADDGPPEVPGFRTWRGVYAFVLLCFVAVVVALTVFTRALA